MTGAVCDFLLIGGGVGAYNAAKRLARRVPSSKIIMVTRDTLPPYHLPPLSKELIRGEIALDDLPYESLEAQFPGTVEVRLNTTVQSLDTTTRTARLEDGSTICFGKALLATGSAPVRLDLTGGSLPGVHYLRTAGDAGRIAREADTARTAIVVGAGFIGVELAASLASRGLSVTLVETTDRIWPRLTDPVLAGVVQTRCEQGGLLFRMGERVTAITGGDRVSGVVTASGEEIACGMVCIGVGARPEVELAIGAGLDCDDGIVVDEHMRTSAPDVFAVGDVARYPDPYLGRNHRAEHWGHAEYSGQIAAMNMLGEPTPYDFLNYVWSDVFDLHIESAGHVGGHDLVVARGDIESARFAHLYFRNRVLVGYTAVNGDQSQFPAYRRLIKARRTLDDPGVLADPEVLARSLLS